MQGAVDEAQLGARDVPHLAPRRADHFDLLYDVFHFALRNPRVHRQPAADGSRYSAAELEPRKAALDAEVRKLAMRDAGLHPQAAIGPLFEAAHLAQLNRNAFEAIVESERVEARSDDTVRNLVRGADREGARDFFPGRRRRKRIDRAADLE